ncbi:Jerky-like protein, partial [Stegodyphus mimosarum]
MPTKRKRVVLTMKDKINIIIRLKQGESGSKLADEYGVGKSTISDIKKNSESILKYVSDSEDDSLLRKTMRRID